MISEKVTLYGYDIPIQELQKKLYRLIPTEWGITQNQYNCYGRAYRNQKENGYVPEVLKANKEYSGDLFGSDKVAVHSFFGVAERGKLTGNTWTIDAHLIFRVNLKTIKPDVLHRADHEAHRDVYSIIRQVPSFTVKETITGINNVFAEYQGWNDMKHKDMHPVHYFRFNMELTYNPEDFKPIPISDIIGE